MHLRSGKALKIMTKSANMSSQLSQSSSQAQITRTSTPAVGASESTVVGATMAMPISTEMGIVAPTTATTVTAQMTQPEMGTFVPPFTVVYSCLQVSLLLLALNLGLDLMIGL